MTAEVIAYASLRAERWANGGGTTRVLAGAAAAAATDWRISIAEVSKAGPFSPYPGMDRILTVISGELVLLTVDGVDHPLEKYRPFRFSGDAPAAAALPTGALLDLNVMTRRGAYRGFTTILELSKKRPHPVFPGQFAVLLEGSAQVQDAAAAGPSGPGQPLNRFDAVVGSPDAPEISGRGFLAVITIEADQPG